MRTREWILTVAALAAGAWLYCSDSPTAGNGSDTPNAAVGALWNEDGSAASGATVRFYQTGADPRTASPAATVTTDHNGRYCAGSLPAGAYNVLGLKGSARSFLDSVTVADHDTTHLPDDTLRAVGSVCGVVKLVGDTTADIYVLALGAGTFATADTAGHFCLSDMAPGVYHVRILTTLAGYGPTDTVLAAPRGTTATLGDTVWINSSVIPVPTGLTLEYDTMMQIVTLTWGRADTSVVASYNVYRRNVDSNTVLVRANSSAIADTVYRDSDGVQDATYGYRVATIDQNGSEGAKSAEATVQRASAFVFLQDFGHQGTGVGEFVSPAGVVSGAGQRFWVADASRDRVMAFDTSGVFVREWGIDGTGPGQLSSPYGMAVDPAGNIVVCEWNGSRIQKFDTLGDLLLTIDSVGTIMQDVSVDEQGSIYISYNISGGNVNGISKYDSSGKLTRSWRVSSTSLNHALLASKGKVFCAGSTTVPAAPDDNVIEVFDTTGGPVTVLHLRTAGQMGVIDIRDLCVDERGRVYAVDAENGKVHVFDEGLRYICWFGRKGDGQSEFSWIQGVAVRGSTLAITDLGVVHLFAWRLP